MRHIYLTVQDRFVLPQLLEEDFDAVRRNFHVLFSDEAIGHLLSAGAGTGETYWQHRHGRTRDRLPFVPDLGALRLHPKAQLEHRGIYHDYGNACYPPAAVSSSPTGTRLLRRTEEMVSKSRLADTYDSPQNPALSRRVATEGSIDGFVSRDESTWHVALSVEPRQRITVSPTTDQAAELLGQTKIEPRAYVHIYPYGGISVTVGLSLLLADDRPTLRVIELIKSLIGRRGAPAFEFQMRGLRTDSIHGLVRQLGAKTGRAIVPDHPEEEGFPHPLDYAISLSADDGELSDSELLGLLTLDTNFENLSGEWVGAHARLYGKYGGDRVHATRGSLAVVTSPRLFDQSGRRRFFWRCHALKEFAALQSQTLFMIARLLQRVGRPHGADEDLTARLLAIAEHLIELPRSLPAHHRKWFYECQHLADGHRATDRYLEVLAALHEDARQAAIMRRVSETPRTVLEINDSQIGTLNLGSIVGNVENNLSALNDPQTTAVHDGLASLAQAAVDLDDLGADLRQQLLEAIDVLAEEARKPSEERRSTVARSLLEVITGVVPTVAALAQVWSDVGPTIEGFFS